MAALTASESCAASLVPRIHRCRDRAAASLHRNSTAQEPTVGVGEKPETVEEQTPDRERGNGGNGGNGRRGSARKAARKRSASDVEIPIEPSAPSRDRQRSR